MSTSDTTDEPPSLRERVYLELREEVLGGRIRSTERLTEPRLSKRYGVSRTPVRDALTRLVADGLLVREEWGHSVVVPSMAQVRDLYEVRIAVELRGISRSIENPRVRHDVDALGAELEHWYALRATPPEPSPEFVLETERFHTALLAASGNAELVAVLANVTRRLRRVRMDDFTVPGRIETSIDEHIEIAERLAAGHLETAHRLLHEHIGASLETVVQSARMPHR
ncbi:GntR family transcriptional regulator [Saccharothrix variisporea]|uniref:GntR family transcriptional regulator n=1 Tax=Saccharothrix variisporea TaxID=543527 RepID=A0A495XK54_9PSEU|nr:GntR family transcriptional regulator [Saccharothrix variisporea]RKT74830.1 GntR family transcriptional regulator [Saccharothrix variisporea]